MKKLSRVALVMLLVLTMLLACACNKTPAADPTDSTQAPKTWKVSFYDSDGVTVLKEVDVEDGKTLTVPEDLTREGYQIDNLYATPALQIVYDTTKPVTEDTAVFVAWRSSVEDNRPWTLAGSLRGYPDNQWGKVWPQDDYRLTKVDGEFNTFEIEVNLYTGDEFKIAVIDEGYVWHDESSVDASHLADFSEGAPLTSGGNAFDTGANIKVTADGKYKLTLKTDAETLALCRLYCERIGDADAAPEATYEMLLWASFNDWQGQEMTRNGDDLIWYCEADVPEGGGEFGIKNAANDAWYSSPDETGNPNKVNIQLEEGHYMFFIELEIAADGTTQLKGDIVAETPAYYVVGTCGNQCWAADANAENTAYVMTEQDGKYVLSVSFTEADTADWTNGQVAFKVVYGCGGRVANENWHGTETGDNVMVDPGDYTITYDPATGTVIVEES